VNLGPADQLIMYGATRPSATFYAKRKIIYIPQGEEDRLRSQLGQAGRTMILLPESFLEKLPAEARRYQPILKRFGYLLLSSEPMVSLPENAVPPPAVSIPGH
jgi:hypothetical protein